MNFFQEQLNKFSQEEKNVLEKEIVDLRAKYLHDLHKLAQEKVALEAKLLELDIADRKRNPVKSAL